MFSLNNDFDKRGSWIFLLTFNKKISIQFNRLLYTQFNYNYFNKLYMFTKNSQTISHNNRTKTASSILLF